MFENIICLPACKLRKSKVRRYIPVVAGTHCLLGTTTSTTTSTTTLSCKTAYCTLTLGLSQMLFRSGWVLLDPQILTLRLVSIFCCVKCDLVRTCKLLEIRIVFRVIIEYLTRSPYGLASYLILINAKSAISPVFSTLVIQFLAITQGLARMPPVIVVEFLGKRLVDRAFSSQLRCGCFQFF